MNYKFIKKSYKSCKIESKRELLTSVKEADTECSTPMYHNHSCLLSEISMVSLDAASLCSFHKLVTVTRKDREMIISHKKITPTN